MGEEIKNLDSVKKRISITDNALEQKIKDLVNTDSRYEKRKIARAVSNIDLDGDRLISKTESRQLKQDIRTDKYHQGFDINTDGVISKNEITLFKTAIDGLNNLVKDKFDNLSDDDEKSYAQMQFDLDQDGAIDDDELKKMQSVVYYSDYTKRMDLDGDSKVGITEASLYAEALSAIETSKSEKYKSQIDDLVDDQELSLTDYENSNGITVTAKDQAKYIIARSKFAAKGNDKEITTELSLNQQIDFANHIKFVKLDNSHDIDGDLKLSDEEKEIYNKAFEDLKEKNLKSFKDKVSKIEQDKGISKTEATNFYIMDLIKSNPVNQDPSVFDIQKLSDAIENNNYDLKYDLNGDFEVDKTEKKNIKDALKFIYDQKNNKFNQKVESIKKQKGINDNHEAKKIIAQESFDIFNKDYNENAFEDLKNILEINSYSTRLDLNQDGEVSEDERQVFADLRNEYINKRREDFINKEKLDEVVKIFDNDEDGQLNTNEFIKFKNFVYGNTDYDLDKDSFATLNEKIIIQNTYKKLYKERIEQPDASVENRFDENGNSIFDNDEKQSFLRTYHNSVKKHNFSWDLYDEISTDTYSGDMTSEEKEEIVKLYEATVNNLKLDLNHDLNVANDIKALENKFNEYIEKFKDEYTGNIEEEIEAKIDLNEDDSISKAEFSTLEKFIEEHTSDETITNPIIYNERYDIDGNLHLTESELNEYKELRNKIEENFQDRFSKLSNTEQENQIKNSLGITQLNEKIDELDLSKEENVIKKNEIEKSIREKLLKAKHYILTENFEKLIDIDGSKVFSEDEKNAYSRVINEIIGKAENNQGLRNYARDNSSLTSSEITTLTRDITAFELNGNYNPKLDIDNNGDVTKDEIDSLKDLRAYEEKKIADEKFRAEEILRDDFKDQFNTEGNNTDELNQIILSYYDQNNDGEISNEELKELINKSHDANLIDLDGISQEMSDDEERAYDNFIKEKKAKKNAEIPEDEEKKKKYYIKYAAEIFNIHNTSEDKTFADAKTLDYQALQTLNNIIDNKLIENNIDQNKYDLNFNQKLDSEELEFYKDFRDAYYEHVKYSIGEDGYYKLAFDHFDRNNDGFIDEKEFKKLEERAEYISDRNIDNKSNKALDFDRTEHISDIETDKVIELYDNTKITLQNFYDNSTDDEMARKKIDLNGNGVIDKNEAKYLNQMVTNDSLTEDYKLSLDGSINDPGIKDIYSNLNDENLAEFIEMTNNVKELEAKKKFDLNLDGKLDQSEIESLHLTEKYDSYQSSLDLDGDFEVSEDEKNIYRNLLTTHTNDRKLNFEALTEEQKRNLVLQKLNINDNSQLDHSEMKLLSDIAAGNITNNAYDINGDLVFTKDDRLIYENVENYLTEKNSDEYRNFNVDQKQALAFSKFDMNGDDKLDDNELNQLQKLISGEISNSELYDLNHNLSLDDTGDEMGEMSVYEALYDNAIKQNIRDFSQIYSKEEQKEEAYKKLAEYMVLETSFNSVSNEIILEYFGVEDGMTEEGKNKFLQFIKNAGIGANLNDDHKFVIDDSGLSDIDGDVDDLKIYEEMFRKMVEENKRIKDILNSNNNP